MAQPSHVQAPAATISLSLGSVQEEMRSQVPDQIKSVPKRNDGVTTACIPQLAMVARPWASLY
ncbi:MAG: hypothetical protein WCN95_06125 [bacterium]